MNYLDILNKEQKEAVTVKARHVRVIAGAGSGKTRVLTTRIVYLVTQLGYNPRKICAITFTNKAANEMKHRLESMLDSDKGVFVSTIHGMCVRIIREEFEALSLVRNFTIVDEADQNTILREAYQTYGYERRDLSYKEVLAYISNNKIAGIGVEQAYKIAGSSFHEEKKAKLYDYYTNRLKQVFALDFDDLLIKVRYLFKNNEKVLEKWQHRFNVYLVDEFQDVDHIQYEIIDLMVGTRNELYVVGDPDQTIYTWRGAQMSFIVDFNKHYPDAQTITLHQNYRSTQNILDSANRLIQFNKGRIEKDLKSNKAQGHPVVISQLDDETDEAYWIVRQIRALQDEGQSFLDMAVLYRSNYLSRVLERVLTDTGIPYIIYGGIRFYDRKEIKDMMSYLRMVSHGDDLALRRSIGAPKRGIGPKTIDNFFIPAQEENTTIYEKMKEAVNKGGTTKRIQDYVALIESFKKHYADHGSIENLMIYILQESGLRKSYEKDEDIERLENLKALMGEAKNFQENTAEGLAEYVQMVSLYGDREEVLSSEYVRLMTAHGAKGLEFDTVFLMGMNESVFPSQRSILESKDGLTEERRLAYVAITRAKHRLFVTSNGGYNYVIQSGNRPSRFIKEMANPETVYDVKGVRDTQSPQEKVFEKFQKGNQKIKVKPADEVVHDDFGSGIVLAVNEDTVKIAFNYPFGTKVIARNFAGLRLKGDLT